MLDAILTPPSPELTTNQLVQLAPYAYYLGRTRPRFKAVREQGSLRQTKRGHGLELLELRAYQPHDEVKHIDWRVTARTGQVHTRVYAQENDHVRQIFINLTDDAYFGTQHTFISTRYGQLAALLAYRAKHVNEQLKLHLSQDNHWHGYDGARHWHQALAQIAQATNIPRRGLTGAPFHGIKVKGHDHCCLILSNRFELEDREWQFLNHLSKHHSLTWVLIDDQNGFSLPSGQYRFHSIHGAATVSVNTNTLRKAQKAYEHQLGHFKSKLHHLGGQLLRFDVANSPVAIAQHLLRYGVIR